MIYQFKDGSHTAKLDAQAVGEHLEHLRELHGQLTAEVTVDDARPKNSLLHPVFEWNNKVAAEEYRKEQARLLIRSVVVIPGDDQGPAQPYRAFVVISEFGEQGYTSTYVALNDPQLRAQVLARALRELRQFQAKYRELDELAEVFSAAKRLTNVA